MGYSTANEAAAYGDYSIPTETLSNRTNKNFWGLAAGVTPEQKRKFFNAGYIHDTSASYFNTVGLEGPTNQVASNGMTLTENQRINTNPGNNKHR